MISLNHGKAIRGDEIFSVADHQDPLAVVGLAQLGEVGHTAREVDHANVKVARQEGNHAVGEGVPCQKQAGAILAAGGGFLIYDEEGAVGSVQERAVLVLLG